MGLDGNAFVRSLLPDLASAGRYSKEIQRRVQAQPAKGGANAFQQALTDADLSVQGFLEVVLLAKFPGVAFFSEEQDQSLNAKYFSAEAPFEVLLDPIDGTRAYLDGAERYQIILSLRDRTSMLAALCYMPRRELCYAAVRGAGAWVYTAAEMSGGTGPARKVELLDRSRRVVLFNAPEIRRQLGHVLEVEDILEAYRHKGIHYGFTELFTGEAAACIHPNPQLIDAGALAFIAQEAGAAVSDFGGNALDFSGPAAVRLPGVVMSASREMHGEILHALHA